MYNVLLLFDFKVKIEQKRITNRTEKRVNIENLGSALDVQSNYHPRASLKDD